MRIFNDPDRPGITFLCYADTGRNPYACSVDSRYPDYRGKYVADYWRKNEWVIIGVYDTYEDALTAATNAYQMGMWEIENEDLPSV